MALSQPVGGPLIECHRAVALDSASFNFFFFIIINGIKVDIGETLSRFFNDMKR